jgi:RND family efflux transporter, MFP subunit
MKYYYILLPFVLVGLSACSNEKKVDEAGRSVETVLPDARNEVTVFNLQSTDFNHELISNGKLSARRYVDLYFESAEPIASIFVKNGDRVVKGQKLAELSTFRLQNKRQQANDALESARLSFQDVLIGQGYALEDSANVPDDIIRLAGVKSGYNQALSQYELAQFEEQNAILIAPFSGVVANLFAKDFNIASISEAFCTIIDMGSLEASFTVLESELSLIKQGDKVEITPFALSDIKVESRITEINPIVSAEGMVQVRAAVNNNGKLFEGMNVRVSVHRSVEKQFVIPKSALVLRSAKPVVFTLVDGKAYWNYVKIGLENADYYTITEGLKESDIVITSGNINLAHEAPVTVIAND